MKLQEIEKGELFITAIPGLLPENVRLRATGEQRQPKKGEWFLSVMTEAGYQAEGDLAYNANILEPVLVTKEEIITVAGPYAPKGSGCFAYNVPVYVEIKNGKIVSVKIDDSTPIYEGAPRLVGEDNEESLEKLIAYAKDGQEWPSWGWI